MFVGTQNNPLQNHWSIKGAVSLLKQILVVSGSYANVARGSEVIELRGLVHSKFPRAHAAHSPLRQLYHRCGRDGVRMGQDLEDPMGKWDGKSWGEPLSFPFLWLVIFISILFFTCQLGWLVGFIPGLDSELETWFSSWKSWKSW